MADKCNESCWAGNVFRMKKRRICSGKRLEVGHLEDIGRDDRVVLKCILRNMF